MDEIVNSYIFINVLLPHYFQVSLSESAVCVNNLTEQPECCTDYKNKSGNCEACIGSWGKDCLNRCDDGFYGHGCRNKCQCSDQMPICDSKQGCTNRSGTDGVLKLHGMERTSNTTVLAFFLPFTCFLVFLLLGTLLYFYQLQEKRKNPSTSQLGLTTCAGSNHLKDQTEETIYNDIRESHYIDSRSVEITYNLSTCFSKDCSNQVQVRAEELSTQDMLTPTYSRVLGTTEYESCFKESEGYSRLELRTNVLRNNNEGIYIYMNKSHQKNQDRMFMYQN